MGLPELAILTLVMIIGWSVLERFGMNARLNALLTRSYRQWESGQLEDALQGYDRLQQQSQTIRNEQTRNAFQFASLHGKGMILRSLGRSDEAEPCLREALNLVDDGMEQPSETVLMVRIEFLFCHAIQNRSAECEKSIARIAESLDKFSSDERLRAYFYSVPHLAWNGHQPRLQIVADRVLQLIAERTSSATHPLTAAERILPSAEEPQLTNPASQNAFQAPRDITPDQSLDELHGGFWVDSKVGQASIAAYSSNYERVAEIMDQVQTAPIWFTLEDSQTRNAIEMRAHLEQTCGSLAKSLDLAKGVLEARVHDGELQNVIAQSEMQLASICQGYGDYQAMLHHAKSAHDRIKKVMTNVTQVSAWFPCMYAIALMERGDFDELADLIKFAESCSESDQDPFSRSIVNQVQTVYFRELGRNDDALSVALAGLSMIENSLGIDSLPAAERRLSTVPLLMRNERFDHATEQLAHANAILEQSTRTNAYSRSQRVMVNAAMDIHLGHWDLAKRNLIDLRSEIEPQLLPNHSYFASIEHSLGIVATKQSLAQEAQEHLERAIKIKMHHQPPHAPELHDLVNDLAKLHVSQGNNEQAIRYREQMASITKYRQSCR